jgi:DNA (cytosine-5)-methyltransferase 1
VSKVVPIADLFCGAGGTSQGAVEAIEALGFRADLTAINHWPVAVATHEVNHPTSRHLCASLDSINPRDLFRAGELKLLWASPECTHHSVARGGTPINDQSRATAWCVTRWAEALRPETILVENVPEFRTWGPIGSNGRPLKSKRGETFAAWLNSLRSLGYTVDHRILVAADYGDPTTRRRLFVQAVRGKRKVIWPEPTHAPAGETDLLGTRKPWVPAREIIDWKLEGQSIYDRKRPLSPKTMRRIMAGLEKFGLKPFIVPNYNERPGQAPRTHDVNAPAPTIVGSNQLAVAEPFLIPQHGTNGPRSVEKPAPTVTTTSRGVGLAQPFLISMEHGGHLRSVEKPLNTVTTAKGGAHGLAQPFIVRLQHDNKPDSIETPLGTVLAGGTHFGLVEPHLLPQNQGGELRPVSEPAPTVATKGAVALVSPFLVEYYGNGASQSVGTPLNTVTTKDRHALVRPVVIIDGERYLLDIRFRMLQPHELAGAQGFRRDYKFTGTKTDQVKQIGNAVPRRLARAIVAAALSQNSDVSWLRDPEDEEAAA